MDVYLISLSGQGDQDYKVVDKETFDWICSSNKGKPKGEEKESGWYDTTVPQSQIELLNQDGDANDSQVYLTSGSYQNDRALFCASLPQYDSIYSIKELMSKLKENGDTLVDEWEGYIY
jgi:hypothetical protein